MSVRWIATLGFLVIFAGTSLAQMGGRMAERRAESRRGSMMKELNLTPDQETKIKKLRLELEKKQTVVDPKIKLARIAMKEVLMADKLDRAAIEKQVKEISGLQLEKKLNFVDHMFAVYNILTPEQQKTWKEHLGARGMGMLDEDTGMMRNHPGMMMGGGDNGGMMGRPGRDYRDAPGGK
jgi:Spy/CpxP family protein refolding chaperone